MSLGSVKSSGSTNSSMWELGTTAYREPGSVSNTRDREKIPEKAGKQELSEEQKQQVNELKARDAEVKAHEAAHMAAGGGHVRGGASYSYQTGPDGHRYAVGGEVSIDTSAVKDNPSATIQKMQAVRSAALAPATPSGQDRAVAAAATAAANQARQALRAEQGAENESDTGKSATISGKNSPRSYDSHGQKQAAAQESTLDLSA